MVSKETTYEHKFFYRLLKVLYYAFFLIACLISILFAWVTAEPKVVVNVKDSTVICSNGKTYPLKSAGVLYVSSVSNSLDGSSELRVKAICTGFDLTGARSDGYSDLEIDRYIEKNLPLNNYELKLSYETKGSWVQVLLIGILGMSISYVVLNVIQETLLYIALGKRIEWNWLKKLK